jgi:hypothetical protein
MTMHENVFKKNDAAEGLATVNFETLDVMHVGRDGIALQKTTRQQCQGISTLHITRTS